MARPPTWTLYLSECVSSVAFVGQTQARVPQMMPGYADNRCSDTMPLGQQRRQEPPIVSEPRLIADDGNRVAAERTLGQFLDQTRRGHAVADDDERLAHRFPS